MWLLSIIIAAVAWYVRKRIRAQRAPMIAYWTYLEYLHFPASIVQDAVIECFGEGERFGQGTSTIDIHTRGDARIQQVVDARLVELRNVPSTFCIGVDAEPGRTLVTMRLEIDRRQVRMPLSVAKQFDGPAKVVFEEAMQRLHHATARMQSHRQARQERRENSSGPAVASDNQTDYAALGLKPGATREQIHAAYRDACRKYHPDRLTGQSVEPHLVELAVQRFKEVSAAYQRLKQPPASAHVKA